MKIPTVKDLLVRLMLFIILQLLQDFFVKVSVTLALMFSQRKGYASSLRRTAYKKRARLTVASAQRAP